MSLLSFIPPPPGSGGFSIGPFNVRLYGILIATGVIVAMTLTRKRYQARGGDPELADRASLWAVGLAFVGARLAYVLPRIGQFAEEPLSILKVWEGGLALYGGLTVGLVVLVVYLRRHGGDLVGYLDAVAPTIALAQAIGRWGNYFNQELYGRPTTLPWALEVDPQFRVAGFEAFSTFHPTFLYESLWNLGLAGILFALDRRKVLPKGGIALLYGAGYALARFGLELLRIETTFRFLGLSRNAMVSLVVFVGCLVGLVLLRRREARARPGELEEADGDVDATDPQDDSAEDARR